MSATTVIHHKDIIFSIFEDVPLSDLSHVRGAHATLRLHVESFLAFLLKCLLAPFLNGYTNHFLEILHDTRSSLSGSIILFMALHATSFLGWHPNDVDVYCPQSSAKAILNFLTTTCEYTAIWPDPSAVDAMSDYNNGITTVVHLYNPHHHRIDVVISTRASFSWPIAFFWNTHVMNWATPSRLCVCYPITTLQGKGQSIPYIHTTVPTGMITPPAEEKNRTETCKNKYINRGFQIGTFADISPHASRNTYRQYCPAASRSFQDDACLTFNLRPNAVTMHEEDESTKFPEIFPLWSYGATACYRGCGGNADGNVTVLNADQPSSFADL